MCNKLLQPFACGHTKTICTTPCVHALRQQNTTHQPQPHTHPHPHPLPTSSSSATTSSGATTSPPATPLARSDSVKSYASTTGVRLRRNVERLGLKPRVLQRQGSVKSTTSSSPSSTAAVYVPPATRSPAAPSTPRNGGQQGVGVGVGMGGPGFGFGFGFGFGGARAAVSSNATSVDAGVPVSPLSSGSLGSPVTTTVTTASGAGLGSVSTPATPSLLGLEEAARNELLYAPVARDEEQRFCGYYFPKSLTTSRYPCRECYGKGEWEGLRKRWVESYRLGHPMDGGEEGEWERLSGVLFCGGGGEEEGDGIGRAV